MRQFNIILAICNKNGIGLNNQIPWHLKQDLKYFKKITSKCSNGKRNVVIMGRNTYLSLPDKFRPLPDRLNIVLSHTKTKSDFPEDVIVCNEFDDALNLLDDKKYKNEIDNIFVIGGASLYNIALKHPYCSEIYLTRIHKDFEFDTKVDDIKPPNYVLREEGPILVENEIPFQFLKYEKYHEEMQYLDLINNIIENGNSKGDRTKIGTRSIFGAQMRFSLRDNSFPLLTTKRVFWRGVAEELLWFIKGDTNGKHLSEKNIHIWDANGSREFLDSLNFKDREEGDLGPIYGFQWRHFGAEYNTMHDDYSGVGVDQLQQVIDTIKNNPNDRRILLSAWNPSAIPKMALPPCHIMCQFYVANGELSCQMYQRSCDMGLGVPFNIASYSLLTIMIAQITGLKVY